MREKSSLAFWVSIIAVYVVFWLSYSFGTYYLYSQMKAEKESSSNLSGGGNPPENIPGYEMNVVYSKKEAVAIMLGDLENVKLAFGKKSEFGKEAEKIIAEAKEFLKNSNDDYNNERFQKLLGRYNNLMEKCNEEIRLKKPEVKI